MVDFKLEISLILCIVDILSLNVVRLFRCLCWTESCLLCSFISNQWWWFNVLIQRVSYCPQHFVLCSYYKHDSMTSPTSLIKLLFGWTQDQSSLAGSTSNILLSWYLLINIPWMPLLQKPQMYPPHLPILTTFLHLAHKICYHEQLSNGLLKSRYHIFVAFLWSPSLIALFKGKIRLIWLKLDLLIAIRWAIFIFLYIIGKKLILTNQHCRFGYGITVL